MEASRSASGSSLAVRGERHKERLGGGLHCFAQTREYEEKTLLASTQIEINSRVKSLREALDAIVLVKRVYFVSKIKKSRICNVD